MWKNTFCCIKLKNYFENILLGFRNFYNSMGVGNLKFQSHTHIYFITKEKQYKNIKMIPSSKIYWNILT